MTSGIGIRKKCHPNVVQQQLLPPFSAALKEFHLDGLLHVSISQRKGGKKERKKSAANLMLKLHLVWIQYLALVH